MRPTVARIRPAAIEANVARLAELAPGAVLCAVVKASGYGHGGPRAAAAARAAGAAWLAVATTVEAAEIAGAVEGDPPILVLSELDPDDAAAAGTDLPEQVRFTVASVAGVEALDRCGSTRRVHLGIDTGLHRMGATPGQVAGVVAALGRSGVVRLEAVWTHLAVADKPDDPFTAVQLRRFDATLAELGECGIGPVMTHAANSAGLIAHPRSHRDMVRPGIAMYGVAPGPALRDRIRLEPALELLSRVTAVRVVPAGESVSYGRRWYAPTPTRVATVPIGYADGIRRDSGAAGVEVLIRGRRRPILGTVTMDQLMVAVDGEVATGDEVVLIGRQGGECITAVEVAERLGTVGYEVLAGLGARIRRVCV